MRGHQQVFCKVGIKTRAVDCDLERDTVGGLKARILGTALIDLCADKRLVSEPPYFTALSFRPPLPRVLLHRILSLGDHQSFSFPLSFFFSTLNER